MVPRARLKLATYRFVAGYSILLSYRGMEIAAGFEPAIKGFAVPRLATWLCNHTNLISHILTICALAVIAV